MSSHTVTYCYKVADRYQGELFGVKTMPSVLSSFSFRTSSFIESCTSDMEKAEKDFKLESGVLKEILDFFSSLHEDEDIIGF